MSRVLWLALAGALLLGIAPARAWDDYQIIYWQARNQAQLATLKRLGITAATVMANRDGTGTPVQQQFAPIVANGLPWYVENIATDFYASYHRWTPGRDVNWRFIEAQRRFLQNPDDETVFLREPSFADTAWQQRIRDRLIATVREQSAHKPLYYSLGDETGIADLTAFFDFDLSPGSLAGMREWLRLGYGSLEALNAEWGTSFRRWDDVRPEMTRQAMRRSDGNFAAWADFKAWMDVAFARALRMGTDAVHAGDPAALAAIEGVQIPGWGGYDYSLLADAVDVMELADLPLARSLNPRLVMLNTSFSGQPRGIHDIWRALLNGSRGTILWDDSEEIVQADAAPGARGLAYADTWAEIRGGLGRLLIAGERQTDPVAILYSPASFRTQWILERQPQGDAWMTRKSETELESNTARDSMWAYHRAITRLGLQPVYVTAAMLTAGDLGRRGFRALVLPHAIALSPGEAAAIRDFAAAGGTVVADTPPGGFDAHSRRLPAPLIDAGLPRMIPPAQLSAAALGVQPRIGVEAPNGDVIVHVWRRGSDTVIGVQRDFAPGDGRESVVLTLPQPGEVQDLRARRSLGRTGRIVVDLDGVSPALLLVSP
ncbi:MAG: beta-galactosidase [Acetobacteraceae bacterium]